MSAAQFEEDLDFLLSTPARIVNGIESGLAPSLYECVSVIAESIGDSDGVDESRIRRLAESPMGWTDWDTWWAWELLNRYSPELKDANLPWFLVAKPARPRTPEPVRRIDVLPGGDFGIAYAHIPAEEFTDMWREVGMIPGRTFLHHDDYKVRIPADTQSVAGLRVFAARCGFELTVPVRERMAAAADRSVIMRELARATESPGYDLGAAEIVSRSGKSPWPSQRAGVRYIEMTGWRTIIGDEMGTGKTILAILAARKAGVKKLLVVCPLGVREQWVNVCRDWLPEANIVEMTSGKARQLGRADIVVVSFSSPRLVRDKDEVEHPNGCLTALALAEFDGVVIDEGHFLKNPDAQRTRVVRLLIQANDPFFRLSMSGTIVLNDAAELGSNLQLTGNLKRFGNMTTLARTYMSDRENLLELNQKLTETCFLVRLKDHHAWTPQGKLVHIRDVPREVAPDELVARFDDDAADAAQVDKLSRRLEACGYRLVPGTLKLKPKIYNTHHLSLADPERYWHAHIKTREWLEELAAEAGGSEALARWQRAEALVRINKLRVEMARQKFPAMRSYAQMTLDAGEKLVVGVYHQEIIQAFEKAFPGCVSIHGGVSKAVRREARELFANDPNTRLMVLNMESGGVALDGLQTSCQRIAAGEFLWNLPKIEQFFDRVHRGGQRSQVICDYLAAPTVPGDDDGFPRQTIDHYFMEVINSKAGDTLAVTHGIDKGEDVDVLGAVIDGLLGAVA